MMDIRVCFVCQRYYDSSDKSECCGISYKPKRSEFYLQCRMEDQEAADRKKEVVEQKTAIIVRSTKKKDKHISEPLRAQVLKRDKNKCVECGNKHGLHLHHKIHRKDGGKDELSNLETLCELCHAEKHRGEKIYNLMLKSLFKQISVRKTGYNKHDTNWR